MPLLAEAAAADPGGPLGALLGLADLPAADASALEAWRALAGALLTQKGLPRAKLDKRDGFPAELKALKQRMLRVLAQLAADEGALRALAAVRSLPPARYTGRQWELLDALRGVLVPAAAELQAAFAESRQADQAAVAAAAREALGAEDAPTELALALEYRLRHLLVDEYQDTAPSQEALLRRLVAGWQPGDGHTLFCVGDPMQSIYGFREADVTLFLEAQVRGVGGVALEPLSLARNFRSCRAVVDWANGTFAQLLPSREDYERGAVRHAPSEATRDDEPGAGVELHPCIGADPARDADTVAAIAAAAVADARSLEREGGQRSVAVLVRSRSALPPILEALRRRGIEYRGVELDSLAERAVARDLLALARALLHPADRTAWLAALRAPWCGLALADLHALCAGDGDSPVGTLVAGRRERLGADARARLARVMPVLEAARADLGRQPLGSTVRATWVALGGPAVVDDPSDLENAALCFEALDRLAAECDGPPEASAVEAAIEGLMASPVGSPAARVQVMTIHRAKGLEFDTVILPALERTVPPGERQLLYWAPVAVAPGRRGIVLASRGDELADPAPDTLERWMRGLEKERARLELGRLAYVAATRARRRLHLVGAARAERSDDGTLRLVAPRDDSLLGVLWPAVRAGFESALAAHPPEDPGAGAGAASRPRLTAPPFVRLPAAYTLPPSPLALAPTPAARGVSGAVRPEFDWAGEEARAVGAVVHRALERLARDRLPPAGIRAGSGGWRAELAREGLPDERHAAAAERIDAALARLAASPVAAQLLDPAAREAESELALTAELDGALVRVRIDRSFVDAAGTRWIVDWKTGAHTGGGLEDFLSQELERYAPQLERYARVMALYDGRPQRLGLYFPLLDRFVEWSPP
jgi:ATP-dependent exoDNAse (exonuclease V) beta subunit